MVGDFREGDDAARFAEEARAIGLELPPSRRLDPRLAVVAFAVIVAVSLTVGYSTNWMNFSRPRPDPLSDLPGCSVGGVTLSVAAVVMTLPAELVKTASYSLPLSADVAVNE